MRPDAETQTEAKQIPAEILSSAATALRQARTLIITAGAGLGIDSGLPDFRGDQGFWKAYPFYERLGMNFTDLATPRHFVDDPNFAWGFYGHRANMYRETSPHTGFAIMLQWIEAFHLEWFVVTSNVDGQFQKAGFDAEKIVEVHGSIHHLQCHSPCKPDIWPCEESFDIDLSSMKSKHVPACVTCGATARPNILMFNDWSWIPTRTNNQQRKFDRFIANCPRPMTIIEIGAGKAIPTIRWTGETLAQRHKATIIRINPREPQIAPPHISIAQGAKSSLAQINALVTN